jgi:type VI secretion system protein ImpH
MGTALGRQADALAFFTALARAPYRYDFYQTMRRLECLYPDRPRWGCASRPVDEPVRLGQAPELSFAPAPLASFSPATATRPARLEVRLFGLMGPNGPLPFHLTEYARERLLHAGDATFSRFLDLLNHRFITLLYRAWAQGQPHVNRDRPDDDRFAVYIGSLIGVSTPALRGRDAVPDEAKLFHAGTLSRDVRNADGLAAILSDFFKVPLRIEEFVGQWLPLRDGDRVRLGGRGASLGQGTVLGGRVWDRQSKFRIHVGPLTRTQYERFLPGGPLLRTLVDWVRLYLSFELEWDVRLTLHRREVPHLALDGRSRLGWTTWLGRRPAEADADDLCLNAEMFVTSDQVSL